MLTPEQLENSIKDNNNWKPQRLEFKIENGKYFIGKIYDKEFEYLEVSKEEYDDGKFQHKFGLRLYDAMYNSTITFWEYPPVDYKINEDYDIFGHDMDYYLECEDEFGLETYPEFLDNPDMVFVGSKRGQCNRCKWRNINCFSQISETMVFSKKTLLM